MAYTKEKCMLTTAQKIEAGGERGGSGDGEGAVGEAGRKAGGERG